MRPMADRRRVITASSKRRKAVTRSTLIVVLALSVLYVMHGVIYPATDPMTTDHLRIGTGVTTVTAFIIVVALLWRRPAPLVPRVRTKGWPKAERRFVHRLSRKWLRVCHESGIVREEKSPDEVVVHAPRITKVDRVPLGVRIVVQTVPGQPAEDIKAHAEHIASSLGVWFRPKVIGPASVQIIAEMHDPLDRVTEIEDFPVLDVEDMSMEIGRADDGQPIRWRFKGQGGAVVGGIPGAGKTSALGQIVGPLLMSDYARVHIIDGKGGQDWSWAEPLADRYTREDRDLDVVAGIVDEFHETMRRRLAVEHSVSNFWNRPRSADDPFMVLVVDEFQTYATKAGRDRDEKAVIDTLLMQVEQIAKKGRSAGVFVIVATQKPTSDSIPTAIRDQCGLRLAFRVLERPAEVAILGELPETDDNPARAVTIPPSRIGGAVMANEQGERVYLRAHYLPEDRMAEIAIQRTRMPPLVEK